MVDIKEAVEAAMKFASEALGPQRTADLRLEEIESGKENGQQVWLITLSAPEVNTHPLSDFKGGTLGDLIGINARREYKVFAVSKEAGEVLSMKVRLFAVPTVG